jgi:hypothetical protein
MGKVKRSQRKEPRRVRKNNKIEKTDNPNKPEKDISQTKFHKDRSYYGKELLQ